MRNCSYNSVCNYLEQWNQLQLCNCGKYRRGGGREEGEGRRGEGGGEYDREGPKYIQVKTKF